MDTNFFRKYNVLYYKPGDLSLIKKYPFGLNVRVLLYKKGDGEINPFKDLKFEKIRDGNPNYDLLSDYKVLERKKVSINPFEKVKFVEWIKPDGEVIIKNGKPLKENYLLELEKGELEKRELKGKGITVYVFLQKDISDYIIKFENKSKAINHLLKEIFQNNFDAKILKEFPDKEINKNKKIRHHITLSRNIAKQICLIQKEFLENGKKKTISEIVNYLLKRFLEKQTSN